MDRPLISFSLISSGVGVLVVVFSILMTSSIGVPRGQVMNEQIDDFPTYPESEFLGSRPSSFTSLTLYAWESPGSKEEVNSFYRRQLSAIDQDLAESTEGTRTKFSFQAPFSSFGNAAVYVGPSDRDGRRSSVTLVVNIGPSRTQLDITR